MSAHQKLRPLHNATKFQVGELLRGHLADAFRFSLLYYSLLRSYLDISSECGPSDTQVILSTRVRALCDSLLAALSTLDLDALSGLRERCGYVVAREEAMCLQSVLACVSSWLLRVLPLVDSVVSETVRLICVVNPSLQPKRKLSRVCRGLRVTDG